MGISCRSDGPGPGVTTSTEAGARWAVSEVSHPTRMVAKTIKLIVSVTGRITIPLFMVKQNLHSNQRDANQTDRS